MSIYKEYQIYLLYLILLGFFGLDIINYGAMDILYFSIVLFMSYPAIKSKQSYSQMIKWYAVFVFISCLYSWAFNQQNLIHVTGRSYDYFALLSFFLLLHADLSSKEILRVIEMLALTFCISYIIQWLVYPTLIFSMADFNSDTETDKYRARMVGSILCYFLLLFSVNKLLLKRRWKDILYGILGFIPIILQGFRSMVLLTFFAVFAMIPFVLRNGKKTIIYSMLGLGVALIAVNNSLVKSKIEEMERRQENNQNFENEDYIRLLSLNYYWNQQFTKPYEKFIGAGRPVDSKSKYVKEIKAAKEYYHFFWSDLGLVGLSMIIGVPAVLLLVLMYIRCIWRCKDPQIQFVRFTFFIVLVGSLFVNAELYRKGNILLLSLFLYFEYKYNKEAQQAKERNDTYIEFVKKHVKNSNVKDLYENRNINIS